MTYREILRRQLETRRDLNPRYSLRSFAKRIEISPSKLSEILSGKKRLSTVRAHAVAARLALSEAERLLFVLSAEVESASKKQDKEVLKSRIRELVAKINTGKSSQRNAWYFGAVQVLEEQGIEPRDLIDKLGLTELQVESAKRFRKRMHKLYPERQRLTYEPLSIIKKMTELQLRDSLEGVSADFIFLTDDQVEEFEKKLRVLLLGFKVKSATADARDLRMISWGSFKLLK